MISADPDKTRVKNHNLEKVLVGHIPNTSILGTHTEN